jgi:DNA-binding NtrC family response regulator
MGVSPGEQSIRSVIVDDDVSIGGVLRELVSRENVSVEVFSDSRKAVDAIENNPADIVITDLLMGSVSGLEVLCCAKKANPDVIVIIITGHATLETAIQAVKEGAYDYIKKPFKLREMELVFDNAVEKVRLVQRNVALTQELKETKAKLAIAQQKHRDVQHERRTAQTKSDSSPLQFFSTSTPNLTFYQKDRDRRKELYQRLEKIVHLKKDGFLTDQEFKTIKGHIFKSLKRFEA